MSGSRLLHLLFSALVAIAMQLVTRSATATPNFPGAIQGKLQASEAPQCAICHVCGVTGRGTVNTPWGSAMRSRGLEAYSESSLGTALASMERDRVDSDGDGKIDVEAVKAGKDPNPPTCESGDDNPTVPQYGCFGRIASEGQPRGAHAALLVALLVAAAAVRRRRGHAALSGLLLFSVVGGTLSACQSGANLAPRAELFAARREVPPPRMAPLRKSQLATELQGLGLDPRRLPAFQALEPRQLRGVMSTFTRSLGFACTDCHDASDYRVPTSVKTITVHMWDEMTRRFAFEDGAAVYCDSCHQGEGRLLDRRDKKSVAAWMSANFTGTLKKVGNPQESDVECETCHGDPFQPSIAAKWLR